MCGYSNPDFAPGPETREWFLERIHCTWLWEQWTRNPADPKVRLALLASLEKLGPGAGPVAKTPRGEGKKLRARVSDGSSL